MKEDGPFSRSRLKTAGPSLEAVLPMEATAGP